MRLSVLRTATLFLIIVLSSCLFSCQKPKEGKAVVINQEFAVNKVSEYGFEVTARGEIQNVGEVDLKNVVVTGNCGSCGQIMIFDTWFISDVPKTADEKNVINYLSVGAKAEFSFSGVAMYMSKGSPQAMPENLEIKIVSFEPAT